ncbi:MAG TPA: GFA family protein [Solimonas sp.]
MPYSGSCHCGAIAYEVSGEIDQAIECNCSHCSRKGFLLWFVPREQLTLKQPDAAMRAYRFNKHVIEHLFCPTCGTQPFGFGEHGGAKMAAINVRCLDGVDVKTLKIVAVDGRSF